MQGSITGAYNAVQDDVTPSFILLAVQENKLVCYVYELNSDDSNGEEVVVSKKEYTKSRSKETGNPALLASLLS